MMRPRTVVLIGALGLAVGWMARTTTMPSAPDGLTDRRSGTRPLGGQPLNRGPFTEQLRQKLENQPRSPASGRNPFVFGVRRAPATAAPGRDEIRVTREPEITPMPEAPLVPALRLSGIAATRQDDTLVLTAILIDNGVMVFAKAGAALSGGHRVLRVEETAVVIADAAGLERVLRLP